MAQSIHHRGPDDEGFFSKDNILLGFKRLSIIDLSDQANQPLFNEDNTLVMVFNGEIYNYKYLRNMLIRNGHSFSSESDGEVILHLYEDYGHNCLSFLEGMFAFAIYDFKEKKLFLSRDRIGEKPLYYMWYNNDFYFSSEIKSFKTLADFQPTLSETAIVSYFANTQVPAPLTIYSTVYKIVPAYYCIIDHKMRISFKNYWSIDYTNKIDSSLIDSVSNLQDILSTVINRTLVSDVPIGVTLSGGIDSSLVLALIKFTYKKPLKTFTLGNNENKQDDEELQRAKIISNHYGSDHHVLRFDEIKFRDCIEVISAFCEPIGIYDIFHLFFLKKDIREHVKVVLSGNGADEVFAGYSSYTNIFLHAKEILESSNQRLNAYTTINNLITDNYRLEFLNNREMLFSDSMIKRTKEVEPNVFLQHYFPLVKYDNFLDARLFIDLLISVNHSATLPDVVGMANSVEVRAPFLNHNIIEYAAKLPLNFKVNCLDAKKNKYILKKLSERYLPMELIYLDKLRCGQFIDYDLKIKTVWKHEIEELFFNYSKKIGDIFCPYKLHILWEKFLMNRSTPLENQNIRKLFIFLLWHKFSFKTVI